MRNNLLLIIVVSVIASSCSYDRSPEGSYNPNNPGFEYAPEGDMYHGSSYDPLSQSVYNTNEYNPNSMNMREPAKNTIAHGKGDYVFAYENTPADYERAGAELKNPYAMNEENIALGKKHYENYCWQCHGLEGKNNGPVMESGKFPKPGSWKAYSDDYVKNLPDGKIYFSITYGKNLMGAHGSILNPEQRWLITNYVKYLSQSGQSEATETKAEEEAPADSSSIDKGTNISSTATSQK